ncbi:AMIN-like domain-containing (lipo)protein [Blastococcus sp. SYSU D00868]
MSPRSRSRSARRLATALAGGADRADTPLPSPPSAPPGCATAWGSLRESASGAGAGAGTVDDIRTGRHDCFDRIVIDIDGAAGDAVGYSVGYVSQFREDATGDAVPLRGAADLQIVVTRPAHTDAGAPTYAPRTPAEAVSVAGYRTFRQVAWGQSFEGQSTVGLGVRARLPFRVHVLDGPGDDARLVVDVAHTW